MARKLTPKRTSLSYLRGWYLVAYKGDTKQAHAKAKAHRELIEELQEQKK